MEQALIIIGFIVGIVIIVKGGDFFVDAASWFAEVSGIPKIIVGATIVSLATTLPEVLVSAIAAMQGKVDMAIGNAIGSVTANTGLILAVSIIFMPLAVKRRQFMPKALLLITAVVALGALSRSGSLTATSSILMLVLFAIFIYENIKSAKADPVIGERPIATKPIVIRNCVKFVLGVAGIVIGSQLLVNNGSELARMLGIPENIIGLTAVAIGTSLPELVTAVTAIMKKQGALSVGNILGANIIDTALILPLCALISGGSIPVAPQVLNLDLPICLLVICIGVIPTIISQKFRKWQGFTALAVYLSYLGYICFVM